MENLIFKDITIQGKSSYIGIISYNSCTSIQNIVLDNISCTGTSSAYVGGLFGYTYPGIFSNITGTNITVNATSSYVGGIFGYIYNTTAYTNQITDISICNVYVHSNSGNYVGGIFGVNNARNGKRYTVKDVTIDCNNCKGVGGVTGYLLSAIQYVYVYGVNIITNGTSYVGGISGYGAGISDGYIEGYAIDDIEAYNTIKGERAENVGAIAGYTHGSLIRVYAKNLNVTGNTKVGGILGWGISCAVYNAISQDCTVTGNTYVGGIMGALTPDSYVRGNVLSLYNTYNNNIIIANNSSAGGILGYLNNSKMNNKTYVSRIYRNYVACADITSPSNTGGFIGEITNPLYYLNNNTKYYYSNLIVSNIDEQHPIGNIDSIEETYTVINTIIDEETGEEITKEENVTRTVPPDETISRLFNSLFYQYTLENDEKALVKEKLDTLKAQTTYTGTLLFGNNKTYYDYTNIDTMFPTLSTLPNYTATFADESTKLFEQTGISLPKEGTGLLMLGGRRALATRANVIEKLPIYNIYASDVDKINLEFDNTYSNAYFMYKMEDGTMSDKIWIEKRTYTFQYDFNESFYFILGNSSTEEEYTISANDISKKITILNGNYYYLQNNYLYENTQIVNEYEYVHLWKNQALTNDGYIYSISQNERTSNKIDGLVLLDSSTPLSKFIYDSNIVETYYHYTKIIDNSENISDYQMFMKNGNIYVLDGNLKIYGDSIVVDSYNNKQYETALGLDGIIYDFKDKINYPEGFENENIIQMTNNFEDTENIIGILYNDGRIYIFNYITGNTIFDSFNKTVTNSLLTKVKSLFNINKSEALYNINDEEYEQAMLLQEKLTETPIEDLEFSKSIYNESNDNTLFLNETESATTATSSVTDRASLKNTYTTVYDSSTNSYLVYKTSNLINNNNSDNNISETEKIMLSPELKEYYQAEATYSKTVELKGIYFIAITVLSIIVILIIMYKRKNY